MAHYKVRHAPKHPKASASGCVYEHVLIAERALGRHLPDGAEVHHVSGDQYDNRPSNLVICQNKAYHKLLHARARVVRAGGNPNTERICGMCGEIKATTEFNAARTSKSGLQKRCRRCANAAWKEWHKQRIA